MATNQAMIKALVLLLLCTATNATFYEESSELPQAAPYTTFVPPSYSYSSYTPFPAPSIKPYAVMLPPIDLGYTPGHGSGGPAIGGFNFGGQNIGGLAGYNQGNVGEHKIGGFGGQIFNGHNIGGFGGQSFSSFGEQHMSMGQSSPTFGGNAFNVANLQPTYSVFGSQVGIHTPTFRPDHDIGAWNAASIAHESAVSGYASGVLFSQQARSPEPHHHGIKIFKKIVTSDSVDPTATTVFHAPVSLQPVPVHYYTPPDTFVRPPSRLEKIKEFVIEKGYTGGHHGHHGSAKIQKVIELDFSRTNQDNNIVVQQTPSQVFVPASHHVYKRSLPSASSKTSIQDISSGAATEKKVRDKRLIPILPPPLLLRPRPMLRPVPIVRAPFNIYSPMYKRPFNLFAPPLLRQYRPMYPQMIVRRPLATPMYVRPRRVYNVRTFYPSRIIGSQYRPPNVITVTRYRRSVVDKPPNQNITSSTSPPTRVDVPSGNSNNQSADLKPQPHLYSFKRPPPIMLNFLSTSSQTEHNNNDKNERTKNTETTPTLPEEKYEGAKNESASDDKQAELQHQLHPNMHKISLRPPLHNASGNKFDFPPISKFPHRHHHPSFQPSMNWQQAPNPLARFAVPMANYNVQQTVYVPPTRLISVRAYHTPRLYMNQASSEWSNAPHSIVPYQPIAVSSKSSSVVIPAPAASSTTYASNKPNPVEHHYAFYPAFLPTGSPNYRLRYINT